MILVSCGVITSKPSVAELDIQNPTDHARSGSHTMSTMIARPSMRRAGVSRPRAEPSATNPAIIAARNTEGSPRVTTVNHNNTNIVNPSRHDDRARISNGPITVKRNATFCPDTAVRCDKPLFRNAVIIVAGCCRSSPMIRPIKSAPSSRGITAADRANASRILFALKYSTAPLPKLSLTSRTAKVPTMCRYDNLFCLLASRRKRSPVTHSTSPA